MAQPRTEARSAASARVHHAFTRQVLRTELVRVRALIATAACLFVIFWTVDLMAPEALNHIWRGQFRPSYLNVILAPFILFELWVHAMLRRQPKVDRDVPVIRR